MSVAGVTVNPRPTILVADDDRLVLGVCTKVLEAHGYRVVIATHGPGALMRARHERPALILMDVFMEGLGGFEACRLLRAESTTQDTPIILMTALREPELEAKAAQAGATLSLRKPLDPEQIAWAVDQVLERGGARN